MGRATLKWVWGSLLPWAGRSLAHTFLFVVMVVLIDQTNKAMTGLYWSVMPTSTHGWLLSDIPIMFFHVLVGLAVMTFFGVWVFLICSTYGFYFLGGRDSGADQPEPSCTQSFVDSLPEDLR